MINIVTQGYVNNLENTINDVITKRFTNLKLDIDNIGLGLGVVSKTSEALLTSGTLSAASATIQYANSESKKYNHFIVYIYLPADDTNRSIKCKIDNTEIGKITNISGNNNQIIALDANIKGYWILEFN